MTKIAYLVVTKVLTQNQYLVFVQLALILGLAFLGLFAVGLYQNPAVHEAFHDVRHAAGFPCH